MVNKVILIGNLGADPELRTTGGGTPVANLRVATTYRRKDDSGAWTDQTEWHQVVVFGKTAENVGKYLKKGRQVYVDGRLQTRKWQDKEGRDRWTTEIIANEVRFLGGRGDNAETGYTGPSGSGYTSDNGQSGPTGGGGPVNSPDEDIPF